MKKFDHIKVGISIGDINGIGIEIILKTFNDRRMLELCTPVLFGSNKLVSIHKKELHLNTQIQGIENASKAIAHKINLVNVWKEHINVEFGKETNEGGKYAYLSLKAAVNALKKGEIDVLVTAPIHKHNIQSDAFNFSGHTEYLEANLEGDSLMILLNDELKVGLITGHIPIHDVAKTISPELISKKVNLMHNSLVKDFGIDRPKIAVLGLNPHCGDNGVIGEEDEQITKPTLEQLQKEGKIVYGPYAADGFFGSGAYKNFDAVLAMYHDQGLAPFKTLAFGKGVNFTAGLDKIRTSPDHGTAFEIAGSGKADYNSFKQAVYVALDVYKARTRYLDLIENKLEINK